MVFNVTFNNLILQVYRGGQLLENNLHVYLIKINVKESIQINGITLFYFNLSEIHIF